MRVIIFGATGMVGRGTLIECLDNLQIDSVLVVGRRSAGVRHPKVTELLHQDFFDYSGVEHRFADCDACFFCLGVSAAGRSEALYSHLTYDLTLAAAQSMVRAAPGRLVFCYVSGEGTDSSEHGRAMWARVKGKTENALLRLPFKAAYMLRPAFIQPQRGVRSSTPLYQLLYTVLGPLYPLWRLVFPRYVTTTVSLGRALIYLATHGYEKPILHTVDINAVAALEGSRDRK
ncbi:MAG TPA: hypothetical protein VN848_07000 [Gemmatimonadales bacterium]|nr:hypothetical protein [Gemmatimonadales bacterium]